MLCNSNKYRIIFYDKKGYGNSPKNDANSDVINRLPIPFEHFS